MLTSKEKEFITHWESVREEHTRFSSKLLRGLPMAILFTLPIVLFMAMVYFLSPDWYTKISQIAGSSSTAILLALFLIVLFFSVARMHFKWEMNEQIYEELKKKSNI
jgi:hypothetical protein